VRLSKTGTSRLSAVAEVLGQVPRSEVGALFNWADVFVLPSLVEGSATVIYEALVRGVPVICTPNAGSIVDDGRTGLLVAPRNASSLADALNRLAMEPDFLDSLRQTAKAERHAASLEKYEENLLAALRARLAKVV
jgi:glycosyltransferase involved in cell wall biosynthesis